jgi:cytochrome c
MSRDGCESGKTQARRSVWTEGRKWGRFTYSSRLKNSGITWDDATLEKWLSDSDIMVPDNDMSINVAKAAERQDLIAILKQRL